MNNSMVYVTLGIVLALLLVFSLYLLISLLNYKRGVYGNNRLKNLLNKYTKLRGYKLIKDVTIQYNGKKAYFENIVIGIFGILIVSSMDKNGEYYGELRDENWVHTIKNNRTFIDNPLKVNQSNVEILRKIFADNKIYKVHIDDFIVLTGFNNKTELYTKEISKVLKFKQFKHAIKLDKFQQDKNINLDQITQLIKNYTV